MESLDPQLAAGECNHQPQIGQRTQPTKAKRARRWLYCVVVGAAVFCLLELLSWQAILHFNKLASIKNLQHLQSEVSLNGLSVGDDTEAIHPYLGWVLTPGVNPGSFMGGRQVPVNHLGFVDDGTSIYRKSDQQFIVGVCGGSVAQQMSLHGEKAFRERLESAPEFHGREIRFVRLALSGYKQPQSLMALNFLLTLGAEFDVLINIDGYNEIALPTAENDRGKVFAAYPRSWDARLQDVVDPRVTSTSYRLLKIRATRREWAGWITTSWFRGTWTANLIWTVREEWLKRSQADLAIELRKHGEQSGRAFARCGPNQTYDNEDEMYQQVIAVWVKSSQLMHQICQARGIRYLHFLQPNQYYSGSKPLSEEELKNYIVPDQDYGAAVARGYPTMIEQGERLHEEGVGFYDLTQLFAQETGTIYCDYFCHYNQRGNDLLATVVADRVIDSVRKQPRSTP